MRCCPKCKREYSEKDFYGKEFCFRCSYKRKTEKDISDLQKKRCRLCDKIVGYGRQKYCSEECYLKSKKDSWYLKLHSSDDGWKNNPVDYRNLSH